MIPNLLFYKYLLIALVLLCLKCSPYVIVEAISSKIAIVFMSKQLYELNGC